MEWDTTVTFLGHKIRTHIRCDNQDAAQRNRGNQNTIEAKWPRDRQFASVQGFLGMTESSGTYNVRYESWIVFRLTPRTSHRPHNEKKAASAPRVEGGSSTVT